MFVSRNMLHIPDCSQVSDWLSLLFVSKTLLRLRFFIRPSLYLRFLRVLGCLAVVVSCTWLHFAYYVSLPDARVLTHVLM